MRHSNTHHTSPQAGQPDGGMSCRKAAVAAHNVLMDHCDGEGKIIPVGPPEEDEVAYVFAPKHIVEEAERQMEDWESQAASYQEGRGRAATDGGTTTQPATTGQTQPANQNQSSAQQPTEVLDRGSSLREQAVKDCAQGKWAHDWAESVAGPNAPEDVIQYAAEKACRGLYS